MKPLLTLVIFFNAVLMSASWIANKTPRLTRKLMASVVDTTGTTLGKATQEEILQLKSDILQLGAALDRGQAYNPTSGSYYKEKMDYAKEKVSSLITKGDSVPKSLDDIAGEWELIFSSVPPGIFRSSPFFLAIQVEYTHNPT